MHRPVFVLDVTDFRPMNSRNPRRFLQWITRSYRDADGSGEETSENAASMLQSDRARNEHGIDLIGAWYAVGVTGHDQFRAFSLYECRGGWDGGWRDMIGLYRGVPDSMFLSSIDDIRFQATSLPLVGAPGCPRSEDIATNGIGGDFAMLEIADVRPGATLDYLAAVRAERAPMLADHDHTLAGLYEVAFTRTKTVSLWVTDLDGHVEVLRARDAALGLDSQVPPDHRLLDWDRRAAEFHTAPARDVYLAAYPGPLLSSSGAAGVRRATETLTTDEPR